jgi:hypothetical protein
VCLSFVEKIFALKEENKYGIDFEGSSERQNFCGDGFRV